MQNYVSNTIVELKQKSGEIKVNEHEKAYWTKKRMLGTELFYSESLIRSKSAKKFKGENTKLLITLIKSQPTLKKIRLGFGM